MIKIYRKRPFEVEAIQYDGENVDDVIKFCKDEREIELYLGWALKLNITVNNETVFKGDYVVKDEMGKFRVCKPDVFLSTYEEIE